MGDEHEDDATDQDEGATMPEVVIDPAAPEDAVIAFDPKTKKPVGVLTNVGAKPRWACSVCSASWDQDPGPFHTHETPVPGSKSRVTYENHPVEKVSG
jgi:hypothetical protein